MSDEPADDFDRVATEYVAARGELADDTTLTEDGVAKAFAEHYAGCFVYDHELGMWVQWNGSRWTQDLKLSVFHTAREFARAVNGRLAKPTTALGKIAFASAVERATRADPKMAVVQEIWDRDPWVLGTPDGVVDLRTGTLRPNAPDLYISRHTSVAPATHGAATPMWQRFLDSATQRDKELQGFLQRLCGYVLSGDVTEEILTFLYGPGGNGKGVFLATLTGILSEYAVAVPIEVFTAGSHINLEYYRAQMAGARLVTASETESQATWAESQIKEMTGNETPLSARHPYGRAFTYRPQFKLILVGNYAPKLKGRSRAMERRLRVVPFVNTPECPDLDLKEKLKAEWPGILRWMLDGCLMWQRDRLGNATVIRAATSAYFEQQDAHRRWIDDRCILDKNLSLKPGLLLADFNTWAKANGEETVSANAFAELIDRTPGLSRERSNGARLVKGIGLNPPAKGWRGDSDDRDD